MKLGTSGFTEDSSSALKRILLRERDLSIVITSTWRYSMGIVCDWFKESGLEINRITDITPFLKEGRGQEIKKYLSNNDVDSFVILDDEIIEGFDDNFYRVDREKGLKHSDVNNIIEILN